MGSKASPPSPADLLPIGWRRLSRKRAILYLSLALIGFALFTFSLLLVLRWIEAYFQRPLEGLTYYAYGGVFLVTLISSASVVLPIPGLALVLAAAARWDPFWIAVAASMGSALGEVTAYALGLLGGKAVARRSPQLYHKAEGWMRRYGLGAVFFFALVPLMVFDFVGIAAGALRLPLWQFTLAVWLARLPRAFAEVYTGGQLFAYLLRLID